MSVVSAEPHAAASAPLQSYPQDSGSRPCPSDGEQLFLSKLRTIERIVTTTCRRFHLTPQDAEDFSSIVKLRFIEEDYALLRSFRGHSCWTTYLTALIRNQCRDFLIGKQGKWRISKKAHDLGLEAMLLEQLSIRDGFLFEEAVEILTRHRLTRRTRDELRRLGEMLPSRARRRVLGEEHLPNVSAQDFAGEERLLEHENASSLKRVQSTLAAAFQELDDDEQRVIRLQFQEGLNLTEIASRLRVRRRSVYTVWARCLRRLRRALERRGLTFEEIARVLSCQGAALMIDFERLEVHVSQG